MTDEPLPDVRPDVPHGARIWNYWLGGTDNYAADREIADTVSAVFPEIGDMAFTFPSGSYLVLWEATSTSEAVVRGAAAQAELGSPYELRTVDEVRGWFTGTELIEPGLVPVTRWRPADGEAGRSEPLDAYGGVGRKP